MTRIEKADPPQGVQHPLEPLTAAEIKTAVAVLRDEKSLVKTVRFVSVVLQEPSKDYVNSFVRGGKLLREAFVVLFDNGKNQCFEAIVCLADKCIRSWKHVPGVQPTMTADEQIECEQAVLESAEFQAACRRQI